MALEHIKDCEVVKMQDRVILSGVDKVTEEKVTLTIHPDDYDDWMNGIPVKYAAPSLSEEGRRFLDTGTKTI